MKHSLIAVLAAVVLTGCGPDPDTATSGPEPPASSPTSPPETSSPSDALNVLAVRGAETMDFDATLRFGCRTDTASVLTMTQSPRFMMYLPSSIEPGHYGLAEYNANADPQYVDGKAVVTFTGAVQRGSGSTYGNFYFEPVEGELIIERMPGGRSERFIADLDATLADGDGATVTLTGRIDIEETGSMSMNCAY